MYFPFFILILFFFILLIKYYNIIYVKYNTKKLNFNPSYIEYKKIVKILYIFLIKKLYKKEY